MSGKQEKVLSQLSFIPGRLILAPGTRADYHQLQRFHYRAEPPATWMSIWTIRHELDDEIHSGSLAVAIAVLSYPCLNSSARDRALKLNRFSPRRRNRFINQKIRTISRLIVHPTYRGLGLASLLVRQILMNPPTTYTETFATMGRAHPVFSKCGMKEFLPEHPGKPVYYLFNSRPSR